MKSTRTKIDDHYQEGNELKRAKAHNELFVDGEQKTSLDLRACIANMCCKLKEMIVNAKQSIMYKMLHKYLQFLHSIKGQSWLNGEIKDNPYYLHTMFCLLQSAVTSITTCLCKDKDPSCKKSSTGAGNHFVNNVMIKSEQPAAGHTNMPKTYPWCKH